MAGKQTEVASANIKKAQAALDAANLTLSYTVVTAAVDGQISTVDIQPGQLVQPGQALFYIINNEDAWVVANFKETQLNKMREGQRVVVHVDAFSKHDFEAKITSISGATGASFSVLPPDNASGNFVKVVQRIPVKIEFANPGDTLIPKLRAGMNATVDVHLD